MPKFIPSVMVVALVLGSAANAKATPMLQSIAPFSHNFTFGLDADFVLMEGTNSADVTEPLWAVDLVVPSPGGSTSGCEAADFAGFAFGSIALIERGTCTFATKVANAQAAGALGVLIFNEGNTPDRDPAFLGTVVPFTPFVPVFATSFAVGNLLRSGVLNGATGVTVRMRVSEEDLVPVPEPGTITLLGLGLVGFARSRRVGRAR